MAQAQSADSAQGAPAAEAPSEGEILVTARRRAESLERVPVAVTALGAAQLALQNVNSEIDLQRTVPGLIVRQVANQNDLSFAIRGQSLDPFSGSKAAVLPYFNEVQVSTASASSFYDLASVQVLKGPQGTLFGRNVTGGAVLYTSAPAGDSIGGYLRGQIGNQDQRRVEGAINLPIVPDVLQIRVAGIYEKSDGFVHNLVDDTRLGATDRKSGRLTIALTPAAGIKNVTVVQHDWSDGTNVGNVLWSAYPCAATRNGVALTSVASCLYSPALDSVVGAPGAWASYLDAHPNAAPGGLQAYLQEQKALGAWQTRSVVPSGHRGRATFVTNVTSFDIAPSTQIKNIFGYSKSSTLDYSNIIGAPFGIEPQTAPGFSPDGYRFQKRQISDELQLSGKGLDGSLEYIVGAYYSNQRNHDNFNLAPFDVTPVLSPVLLHYNYIDRSTTKAVFAQGTYDLEKTLGIAGLSFTLGARYSEDKVEMYQVAPSVFQVPSNERSKSAKPSWQIGLDYKPNSSWLFYIVQRGSWRSGGYNGTAPAIDATAENNGNRYLPETTRDLELGAKFAGRVGTMPARLNIALYQQWTQNIQRVQYINLPTGVAAVTVNIPKARTRGVEVDGSIEPTEWLSLGGSIAHTDAKYTSGTSSLFGTISNYGPYGDAPRWSGSGFVQVRSALPNDGGSVYLRGDVYAQTGQYFSNLDATTNPDSRLPGYALVNLRGGVDQIMGSGVSLSAFVQNLGNRQYYVGGLAQGSNFGLNSASPGRSRTYGVEIGVKF